jgi:hypothetical protein
MLVRRHDGGIQKMRRASAFGHNLAILIVYLAA